MLIFGRRCSTPLKVNLMELHIKDPVLQTVSAFSVFVPVVTFSIIITLITYFCLMTVITGFDFKNRYQIKNTLGQQVYFALEGESVASLFNLSTLMLNAHDRSIFPNFFVFFKFQN